MKIKKSQLKEIIKEIIKEDSLSHMKSLAMFSKSGIKYILWNIGIDGYYYKLTSLKKGIKDEIFNNMSYEKVIKLLKKNGYQLIKNI